MLIYRSKLLIKLFVAKVLDSKKNFSRFEGNFDVVRLGHICFYINFKKLSTLSLRLVYIKLC